MPEVLVKSARHLKSHILEITFNDGHKQIVDFAPFISSVQHPDYEQYKSEEKFLEYEIVDGNLNWDGYTMIFPVEDLYANKILRSA
ncbi:DUF2442 domain-containing protein [Microbulbifer aggregans]|uniref:DUF2442 domain-containing protein n=1 Tax=Microbulbifer aggregans TaxID=1769779 RepID=UPI001CFF520F|nr:DUF2442 domain-containing protein [Microbulbifer aggregans]